MHSRESIYTSQPISVYTFLYTKNNMKIGSRKKNGMIKFGEKNIIILILDKSRSVAPGKLEIKLVWPDVIK